MHNVSLIQLIKLGPDKLPRDFIPPPPTLPVKGVYTAAHRVIVGPGGSVREESYGLDNDPIRNVLTL